MCKYLLFAFDSYYPSGGMNDCECKFNSIEDINFDDIYLDHDYYTLYDIKNDKNHGLNLGDIVRRYEDEFDYLSMEDEDKYRLEKLKEFISNNIR